MHRSTDNADPKGNAFRSPMRLFIINGEWWFSTREVDQGPYPTREAAELDLKRYAAMMEKTSGEKMEVKEVKEVKEVPDEIESAPKPDVPRVATSGTDDVIRGIFQD